MSRGRRTYPAAVLALGCLALLSALALPARAAPAGEPEKLFVIKDKRITESSGLATSATLPGVVWTVNDSGDAPRVYGLGQDGHTVATLTLRGARARDWEAVSVGPRDGGRSWLWVGDIGDNLSSWPTVRVYRVPEPTSTGDRDVGWTGYELRFPDGPRDAEALLVDPADGRLYVVSKRVQGAAVYAAPPTLSSDHVNVLTKVRSAPPLVTDGAFASDGRVALRDYLQAWVAPDLRGQLQHVALPLQQQGEGLTWTTDGSSVVVSSEGAHSPVWRVPVTGQAANASGSPARPPTRSAGPAQTPDPADEGDAGDGNHTTIVLTIVAGLAIGAGLAGARASRARRQRGR